MDRPKPKSNTTWPIELASESGLALDAELKDVSVVTTDDKGLYTTIAFRLEPEIEIKDDVTGCLKPLHGSITLQFSGGHGEIDVALFRRWKVRLGLRAKLDESEGGND